MLQVSRRMISGASSTSRGVMIALAALLAGSSTAVAAEGQLPTPKPYRFTENYIWQQTNAKVLPTGNLEWAPKEFVFEKGASLRYIDYENGNDGADGTSKTSAWKHHPWDDAASGKAKACTGIHTYIFKGGVAYRGMLNVKESGKPGDPIRLTKDPSWGEGNPIFHGATTIKSGWVKADANSAPGIPEPEKVWYIDLGKDYDKDGGNHDVSTIWQVTGDDTVERMHIARTPNFDISDPNRPFKNWAQFSKVDPKTHTYHSDTIKDLKGTSGAELNDVVIWATWPSLMGGGTPRNLNGAKWDLNKGIVSHKGICGSSVTNMSKMTRWNKFMLENAAVLLDADGEYFFARRGPHAGRLYLRPAGGVDPNTAVYEVAQTHVFINAQDKSHITISGFDFRYNDQHNNSQNNNYRHNGSPAPCIYFLGSTDGLTVKNNRFYNVADALEVIRAPAGPSGDADRKTKTIGTVRVLDNDIRHASGAGVIALYGPAEHFEIKRNNIYHTGYRGGTKRWDSFPAVCVHYPESCEISGNIVRRTMGIGIITYGGKGSGDTSRDVPLVRYLIHHNDLADTMLESNDYGGLEHFQGGPTYFWNNVSRNPNGNNPFWGLQLGYALYLDGAFKCYTFNNILAGDMRPDEPDYYSPVGYFMVFGFMNQFFNNTVVRFNNGFDGSSGNRSNVVGNLLSDCKNAFLQQNRPGDHSMLGGGDTGEMGRQGIPTMAYDRNLFFGAPKMFGNIAGTQHAGQSSKEVQMVSGKGLAEMQQALADNNCRLSGVGVHVDENPLQNPSEQDYRPVIDPSDEARGVKYFVPWAVARMVGEWNFYKSETSPKLVLGESFYMTKEYGSRDNYYHIPRMDLVVSDCTPEDYVSSGLEDWIDGALSFDGKRNAVLAHAEMKKNMSYPGGKKGRSEPFEFDGSKRETVDMDANNFMIEIVLKTEATTGSLAAKKGGGNGYELAVAANGGVELTLSVNGGEAVSASTVRINDGAWHHVLAEVDRAGGKVTLYVDGQAAGTGKLGLAKDASLANGGDFVVGEGFVGAIDFLRVARSTLAESKTDIDELYTWQFNGPHLHDFTGKKPSGVRSAGAISAN